MRVFQWWLALIAAVALLALRAPDARAAGATLELRSAEIQAGDTIEFFGAGFLPNERVSYWATAPDQAVLGGGYVGANRDGEAPFTFEIPPGAIGGRWAMTAYGEAGKTTAIVTFDVAGRPVGQAGPIAAVAPQSGPPGTTFAFAATGFGEQERISYWFTGPDGVVYDAYNQTIRSTPDGRVDIAWAAPGSAPRGRWVITIQGIRSTLSRGIPFEIR
jgi:hypothetical protein